MRKYIPYVCLLGAIIVITISILFNNSKDSNSFIYYYNSYNLTSFVNEEDYLIVDVFVNNKKTYFVDSKQISISYIENEEEIIDLDIINIKLTDQSIIYKKNEFYSYKMKFKVKFNTSNYTSWFIKNANLIIRYNNNIEYKLKIGDISINKLEENNEIISLSSIKPLTSNINDNTYLTGLIIGVRKTINQNIRLNKIKLLDANLSVGNNIEVLNELPKTNRFEEVANYNYSSINEGSEDVNLKILDNTIYLFIPIYYDKMTISNKFPISLELLINDNIENYILSDYVYYEPSDFIISDNQIILCEIK